MQTTKLINWVRTAAGAVIVAGMLLACGDDDAPAAATTSGPGSGTASSSSGAGGAGESGGSSSSVGGGGGVEEPYLCASVRDQALSPVDIPSTGDVIVLSDVNDVREVYVDGSAGGFQMASVNPYIYLDLTTGSRVDVTDPASFDAASWDIAIKRVAWRNNSADSGGGDGAAAFLPAVDFASVTVSDAMSAVLAQELWFDDMCNYTEDSTGALLTTMSEWYDYDPATMSVTPKAGVYIVRGGNGSSLFKLQILEYYANPDGTSGMTSGRYLLRVAQL